MTSISSSASTPEFLEKAAGLAPEHAEIDFFFPKRMFFSGVLCAARQNETEQEKQERERYRPRSCGLDFIVDTKATTDLDLKLSFNVFAVVYRRFETMEPRPAPINDFVPDIAHVRFPVQVTATVALSDLTPGIHSLTSISTEINSLLAGVSARVASNADALRDRHAGGPKSLPLSEWTEETYHAALRQGERVPQTWKAEVLVMVSDADAGRRIQVFLQNNSEETDTTFALDRNFYGAELSVTVNPAILTAIPLERTPLNDYRYGRTVVVQGINCNSVHDGSGTLTTCFMPTFEQMRYLPDDKTYDLSFAEFAPSARRYSTRSTPAWRRTNDCGRRASRSVT